MAVTKQGAALTDTHRRQQVRTAITADSQARRLWDKSLDLNDLDASQPIWKRTITNLLQSWWQMSADQAADYLPQFREAETGDLTGFEVTMPRFNPKNPGLDLDFFGSTNVKWHQSMGMTRQAAYEAARRLFLGAFHEAVLTGGRKTVEATSKADPRAVGWRRVSDGNPCAFCAMLVTRGPAYLSGETAGMGKKFHAHCGCTVEPVYDDWQPTKQEQQWIDQYYNAAESLPDKTPRTASDILPRMRRQGGFRDSPIRRVNGKSGGRKPPSLPRELRGASADDEASRAAHRLRLRAAAIEPDITERIKSLGKEHGLEPIGLEHRFKTENSLVEKIVKDSKVRNIIPDEAARLISDSLRYTLTTDTKNYATRTKAVLNELRSSGWTVKVKNFWKNRNNPYQGVNVQLVTETGDRIELQFHTPDSFDVKEFKTHALYEEQRQPSVSTERFKELQNKMRELFDSIPVPPGVNEIE